LPDRLKADSVPNFWQVMKVEAKKRTVGKHILKIRQKKRPLPPITSDATINTKKELPI
jgi:hypothetical protein